MRPKPLVKLIKKEKTDSAEILEKPEPIADPNKLAKEVRSWVSDFQKDRREEVLLPFDSLFKP